MTAEGNAGIVDNALVYRAGNQCIKGTLLAAINTVVECAQNVLRIAAIQYADLCRCWHCYRQDAQLTGSTAPWRMLVIKQPVTKRQAKDFCALCE